MDQPPFQREVRRHPRFGRLSGHRRMGIVAFLAFRGLRIGVFLRHHIRRMVRRLQAGLPRGHGLCSVILLFLSVPDPLILFRFEPTPAPNHLRGVSSSNGLPNSLPKEHHSITAVGAG